MRTVIIVSAVIFAGVGAAFAFAPRQTISTEILIAAPPNAVWEVLTDAPRYPEWNPFIVSMQGTIAEGEKLENVHRLADGSEMIFTPTVLEVVEGQKFRWLGGLAVPRIFDGDHTFEMIETETGTRLLHSETFHGIAMWFVDANQVLPQFEAMNAALKAEVEAAN